ncbi:molybdopterin synthase sulfur carrier subunit [Brachybacterium endophyticum]|uniref:Molybdopterin synthase sulfur carrier subunit n=1 Tax=Brachybacterium endophyticum TaxID=2182385 RepID=A0A2U2RI08_9MICO|nr:MoaD/ThiS family protein [Brachybacterium endophyticum]PWH05488.1 molybdopterin synthase sulfur carrier subunit [Brachybacterium endophyticum]
MRVRLFAGAADAAGTEETQLTGPMELGELRRRLEESHGPEFARVLGLCSLLVDGTRTDQDAAVIGEDATVDVLPPFAGG